MDSPIFSHDGMWKLFTLCLMKATHQPIEIKIDGVLIPIHLRPGQFVTGKYALWADYHQLDKKKRKPRNKPRPSSTTLRSWLLTMEKLQILKIKSTNKFTVISINNWQRYQSNRNQTGNKPKTGWNKQENFKKNKKQTPKFLTERWDEVLANE